MGSLPIRLALNAPPCLGKGTDIIIDGSTRQDFVSHSSSQDALTEAVTLNLQGQPSCTSPQQATQQRGNMQTATFQETVSHSSTQHCFQSRRWHLGTKHRQLNESTSERHGLKPYTCIKYEWWVSISNSNRGSTKLQISSHDLLLPQSLGRSLACRL